MILEPKHNDMNGFKTIYTSGFLRTNHFLSLIDTRKPADIYARLQFAPDDVSHERAEFFGYQYQISEEEPGDPDVGYVSPEGKVILLFSKAIS